MTHRTNIMELLNKYYAAWQSCNHLYENWAKARHLSLNTLLVLSDIYRSDGNCTQKKISQKWMIPKQTVHMVLKELEENGFVRLLPMPKDRRNKQIQLTAAGREYADGIIPKLRTTELSVVEAMGTKRMNQFIDHMTLFAELFTNISGTAEAAEGSGQTNA